MDGKVELSIEYSNKTQYNYSSQREKTALQSTVKSEMYIRVYAHIQIHKDAF